MKRIVKQGVRLVLLAPVALIYFDLVLFCISGGNWMLWPTCTALVEQTGTFTQGTAPSFVGCFVFLFQKIVYPIAALSITESSGFKAWSK